MWGTTPPRQGIGYLFYQKVYDYYLAFQASENPAGVFADHTNPQFPSGTLANQKSWEYDFPGFNNSMPNEYMYQEKGKKPPANNLLKEANMEAKDWKTDNADWTV